MKIISDDDSDLFGGHGPEADVERLKIDYAVGLERLRKRKKLSYKDVASRYGKSAGYISRVFRGDENVTIATMVKLADVLEGKVCISVVDAGEAVKVWPFHDRRQSKSSLEGAVVTAPNVSIGSITARKLAQPVVIGGAMTIGSAMQFSSGTSYSVVQALVEPDDGASVLYGALPGVPAFAEINFESKPRMKRQVGE